MRRVGKTGTKRARARCAEYVYADDGTRLKVIEKADSPLETVTAHINGTEIRNVGQDSA